MKSLLNAIGFIAGLKKEGKKIIKGNKNALLKVTLDRLGGDCNNVGTYNNGHMPLFLYLEVKASINTGEQRSPIFQGQRVFFTLARFVQAAPAIFTQYYRQQQYLHGVCVEGGREPLAAIVLRVEIS